MLRLARLGAMRPSSALARRPVLKPNLLACGATRAYNEFNRIDDMFSAADAWLAASALPNKFDLSHASLRMAFDRIDLNGNGVIEPDELKAAILAAQPEANVDDHTVDDMIKWACKKTPNGDIDFEEYCDIMRVKLPSMAAAHAKYFKEQEAGRVT